MVEVYNQTMRVADPEGDGRTTWNFPSYTPADQGLVCSVGDKTVPVMVGDIKWTSTLSDNDPDIEVATAVTRVVEEAGEHTGGGGLPPPPFFFGKSPLILGGPRLQVLQEADVSLKGFRPPRLGSYEDGEYGD
ncbi:MAG: hypothetical protein ACE5JQ_14880 [Candidatus Methylomirabilales bacterium]